MDRACASQKHLLVPHSSKVVGIARESHAQIKTAVCRTSAPKDVADLVLGVTPSPLALRIAPMSMNLRSSLGLARRAPVLRPAWAGGSGGSESVCCSVFKNPK